MSCQQFQDDLTKVDINYRVNLNEFKLIRALFKL